MSNYDVIRKVENPTPLDMEAGAEFGITEFAEEISANIGADGTVFITRSLWEYNKRTKDPRGNRHLGSERLVELSVREAARLSGSLTLSIAAAAYNNGANAVAE